MKSRLPIGLIALFFLFILTTQAFATVVTSGTFQVFPGGIPGDFNLTADGFSLIWGGVMSGSWAANCFPCAPGTVMSIDGNAVGTDFGMGATFGSKPNGSLDFGNVNAPYPSVFSFSGPPIVLNHGAGIYDVPFSFNGALCGFDVATWTCFVDLPNLTGSGGVQADVEEDNGLLYVDNVIYVFNTPEPATLTLLGSGILGVCGLLRRKLRL